MRYCPGNSTFLPVWQHGLSRCLFETVQPAVILVLAIISFVYHYLQRRHCQKIMKNCNTAQVSRGSINDSMEDEALVTVVGTESVEEFCMQKSHFKDFAFSGLPIPFLYFCQILCHFGHVLLPILHIVIKASMCHTCVSWLDILTNLGSFSAWAVGLSALKIERFIFFMRRRQSHSLFLLIFWTVALVIELLAFVSWNSLEWWFTHQESDMNKLDFVVFCLRLSFSTLLFVLGFHAPGLYRSKYEGESPVSAKKKVSS